MPNDLKQTLPKLMSSNGAKKFFFAYAAGKRKDGKGDGELLVRGTKPKKTEIEGEMADCKEVVEGVCWTGKTADDAGTVYMQGKTKKVSAMLVSKISLTAKRITGKQYDFQVPSEAEEARVAALAEGEGTAAEGAAAPGTEAAVPGAEAETAAPGAEAKTAAPGAEVKTAAPVPDGKKAEAAKAPATDGKAAAPSQFKEAQARLKGLLSRQQALLAKNPALKNRLVPASQPATSQVSTYKAGMPIEPVLAALDNLENALLAGEAEAPAAAADKAAPQPDADKAKAAADLAAEYKTSLAEWTPTIKQAMADKGKNAAAIAKRLSQANALSKPGGNYAEALKILGEAYSLAGASAAPAAEAKAETPAATEAKANAPDGKAKKEDAPEVEKKEEEEEEEGEKETPQPTAQKEGAPSSKTEGEEEEKEDETPEPTAEKEEKSPESGEPKVTEPEAKKKSEGEESETESKESEEDEPKEPESKKTEGEEVKAPDKKARAATRQEAARLRKEFEALQPRIETAVANHPDRKDELEKPHKAFVKQVTQRSEAALQDAEKSLAEIRKVLDSVEKAKTDDKKAGKKKEPKDFTTKFKETQELLKQLPEGDDAEDLVDQMEDLEFAVKMEALWSMEGELAPDKVETLKAIKTAAKELIAKGGGAKKSDKGEGEEKSKDEDESEEKAEGEEGEVKAKGKEKKKSKDKGKEEDAGKEEEGEEKAKGKGDVKGEGETEEKEEEEEEEDEEEASFEDALKKMAAAVSALKDDNVLAKGIRTTVDGFKDRLRTEEGLIKQGMLETKDVEASNKDMLKSIKAEVKAARNFDAAVKETRRIIGEMPKTDPVSGVLQNALDNELARLQATGVGQPTAVLKFMNDLEKQAKERLSITNMADRLTGEIDKLAGDNVFKLQLQNRLTNAVASANPTNTGDVASLLTSIQEDVKNAAVLEKKFAELKAAPDEFIGEEANDPIRNELAARIASMQRGAATLRISESFGEIMKLIAAEEKAVASAVEYWKKASEVSAAVDGLDTETAAGKELADQFQTLGKMIGTVAQIPLGMKEMNALHERVKKAAESKPSEKEEESESTEKEGEAKAKKKKGEPKPTEKEEESKEDEGKEEAKTGKKETKPKKEKAKKKEGKEE